MTSLSFISVPDVTPILAQAAGAGGGSFMSSFGMMAVILGIFYFLLIRPQQKEAKEHEALLASLQKGDRVVTASGFHGRIHSVEEGEVVIEIADKVRVTMNKSAVKHKIDAGA